MEGVNYVTCPRCESHVVFVEGDGRPPGACPHCGKAMEGFRRVACVKCEGVFETAVAAGVQIACPRCGAPNVGPSVPGETAAVRKNIPARVRAAVDGGEAVSKEQRGRQLWPRALVGGALVAAVAGASLALVVHRALQPSIHRFPVSALPAAGIAAVAGAAVWVLFLWRAR